MSASEVSNSMSSRGRGSYADKQAQQGTIPCMASNAGGPSKGIARTAMLLPIVSPPAAHWASTLMHPGCGTPTRGGVDPRPWDDPNLPEAPCLHHKSKVPYQSWFAGAVHASCGCYACQGKISEALQPHGGGLVVLRAAPSCMRSTQNSIWQFRVSDTKLPARLTLPAARQVQGAGRGGPWRSRFFPAQKKKSAGLAPANS
jgi:hypothetical protein